MTEKRTGEFAPDTIVCIFVELGRFLKGETELGERFDRMCFPADTKLQYIRDMFTEMDYRAEMKANYQNGFAAGEADGEARGRMAGVAEGLEKGGAARSRDIAAAMLRKGLDTALIASCTGLSIGEVEALGC